MRIWNCPCPPRRALLRDAIAGLQCLQWHVDAGTAPVPGLGDSLPLLLLALPLHNRLQRLVGAILLFGVEALEPARQTLRRGRLRQRRADPGDARELVRDQKALFEALIRLVAGAIDAQEPLYRRPLRSACRS